MSNLSSQEMEINFAFRLIETEYILDKKVNPHTYIYVYGECLCRAFKPMCDVMRIQMTEQHLGMLQPNDVPIRKTLMPHKN